MGLVDNLTPSSCADGELSFSLLHWWWSGVCWSPLSHQQFQEKVLFKLCFIRGLRCMVLSGSKLWNICDCLWSTWRSLFLWRSPSLLWSTRCRSLLWCGYCVERSGPLAIGRTTCFGFNCGKSTWSDCRSLLCLQVSSQAGMRPARETLNLPPERRRYFGKGSASLRRMPLMRGSLRCSMRVALVPVPAARILGGETSPAGLIFQLRTPHQVLVLSAFSEMIRFTKIH